MYAVLSVWCVWRGVLGVMCAVCGTACSVEDFLGLLVKLVHYNSAYLDEDILSHLVCHTCSLANQATTPSVTEVMPWLDRPMSPAASPLSPALPLLP